MKDYYNVLNILNVFCSYEINNNEFIDELKIINVGQKKNYNKSLQSEWVPIFSIQLFIQITKSFPTKTLDTNFIIFILV